MYTVGVLRDYPPPLPNQRKIETEAQTVMEYISNEWILRVY
jgi:hypothetical protein